MSATRFSIANVFNRIFKHRQEPIIGSRVPIAKLSPDIVSIIRDWVNEDCLLTLDDICHRLNDQFGLSIGRDKIACCFSDFHFSIERLPDPDSPVVDANALVLLRKVFADDFIKFANQINLFFIGTTKVVVNTRFFQGRRASPQWAVRNRTFTISAALRPDKLYYYDVQETSSRKELPSNSPEKPESPVKFVHFFRNFMDKLEADEIENANIIMEGSTYLHVLAEDPEFLLTKKQEHAINIKPGDSADFSPLESLFDSLRHHVEKFDPIDPESVFDALKRIPETVGELECAYYFDDVLNIIQCWSEMRFN